MEDCTESHQSEINRKIKTNARLRKILASMPEEHRVLRCGDSFQSKMQSMETEKAALLAAKRQLLPLQCRNEKPKHYLERISKGIEKKQPDTSGNLAEKDRDRPGIGVCPCQTDSSQARHGVFGGRASSGNCQSCEPRVSTGPTTSDRLHVRQSGTTNHPLSVQVCPRDAKQRLQQCVGTAHGDWSDGRCQESPPDYGTHSASAGSRDHASRAWPRGAQAPVRGSVYRRRVLCWKTCLARAAWTSRARNPSREACETRTPNRDVWQIIVNNEEGSSLLRPWFWTVFTAGFFSFRIGEAENPGLVCPTAELYDAQFDEIGQWAANLTNKSECELAPLFAQVGACRRTFSEHFEKKSYPHRSSVSQDIHDTHRHVSPLEPAVRLPHTHPNCDYLLLFHDDGHNGNVVCSQPQTKLRDLCGEEKGNPCKQLAGNANSKVLMVLSISCNAM